MSQSMSKENPQPELPAHIESRTPPSHPQCAMQNSAHIVCFSLENSKI